MQIGDLVRMNKGAFMQGMMGRIVGHQTTGDGRERWLIRFIGPDVPKSIQHKSIPFRAIRFTPIKGSNDGT